MARLQGEPSQSDRDAFRQWRSDPGNAAAYDRIAGDWQSAYGLLAQTHVGRARMGLPERPTRARPFGYAVAAASLAVLLAAVLLVLRPGAEGAVHAEVIATGLGEIRTVTLPDQSRVTLDTDSRLAIRYDADARRLELQEGRARFFVRKAEERPFVVETEGGVIVADDTVFDVTVAPDGAAVSLIEGTVEVRVPAPDADPVRRRLQRGERLLVGADGRLQDALADADAARWPAGLLEFRNAPLREVAAAANRYSARKIRLQPAVGDLRVTGTFRAGDTAGLARSLATAFSLRVEELADGDFVLHPPG